MDRITQNIYDDILALTFIKTGDLTHDQIRDMLVTVRRLKTRLEVLDAKKETDLG